MPDLSFFYCSNLAAMRKRINHTWLSAFILGLLIFIAVCYMQFYLAWICFAPLFIAIRNDGWNKAVKKSFVAGAGFAFPAYYWMIPGAERFTGSSMLYGIAVFLFAVLLFSLWMALMNLVIALLKSKKQTRLAACSNAMLAGTAFAAGEGLLQLIADGMPWFHFNVGFAVAKNVYAIQHAAYGGVYIISFFVAAVNYLIAEFILMKQWKLLAVPVAVICLYVLAGFFIQQQFEKKAATANNFSLAVLSENILPDIKWDDKNGNMLVQKLLQLNKDAAAMKPDVALWSESVVPWTYQPDDDFINEILKTSSAENITHLIGINTAIKDNEVYNSAYCILPDGNVAGRYDKQHLLALIEKPIGAMIFPFLSSEGFVAREKSIYAKPLRTKFGDEGILICNESTLSSAAAGMVQSGANFFCIMGNDGWFNDTYIPAVHFYNARLRAVETRKDVAVNCNNGISGKIDASGNISASKSSGEPFVEKFFMQPNDVRTAAAEMPMLFVYICIAWIVIMTVARLLRN